MEFKLTGKITEIKSVKEDNNLCCVEETIKDKSKKWFVWIPKSSEVGVNYEISGYISNYKDKNGNWNTSYNATSYSEVMTF